MIGVYALRARLVPISSAAALSALRTTSTVTTSAARWAIIRASPWPRRLLFRFRPRSRCQHNSKTNACTYCGLGGRAARRRAPRIGDGRLFDSGSVRLCRRERRSGFAADLAVHPGRRAGAPADDGAGEPQLPEPVPGWHPPAVLGRGGRPLPGLPPPAEGRITSDTADARARHRDQPELVARRTL